MNFENRFQFSNAFFTVNKLLDGYIVPKGVSAFYPWREVAAVAVSFLILFPVLSSSVVLSEYS
jgi:hypothetical protein